MELNRTLRDICAQKYSKTEKYGTQQPVINEKRIVIAASEPQSL